VSAITRTVHKWESTVIALYGFVIAELLRTVEFTHICSVSQPLSRGHGECSELSGPSSK
jgi:hypothetical protein